MELFRAAAWHDFDGFFTIQPYRPHYGDGIDPLSQRAAPNAFAPNAAYSIARGIS
jgi:hypothetical protein